MLRRESIHRHLSIFFSCPHAIDGENFLEITRAARLTLEALMRKSLLLISVLLVAGCTTAPTEPRVWYDRKSNEYRYLTGHVPPIRGAATDAQTARMDEYIQRMQQQMAKMSRTEDPAERQKLMREHMQAMQDHARTMRGMPGCMTMSTSQ